MPSLLLLLLLLGPLLALLALAQPPPPINTTAVTRVVQIFFIAERSYEGLPYTVLHRVSASILSIDTSASLTTLVLTSTRLAQRSSTTPTQPPSQTTPASTTTTTTTTIPALSRLTLSPLGPTTGHPSTITQGPATFLFTHTHPDTPDQTLVNRCSLNGTASARCAMTHVGAAWYARNAAWNGTFSTYRYNWTSGDRFGFAPVTVTAGIPAGGMGEQVLVASASASSGAGAGRGGAGGVVAGGGVLGWVVGIVGVGVGVGVLL